MKRKERMEEKWGFYDSTVEEVEGDTVRNLLRTLLVFSEIGVKVVVTDFLGTILLEDDLERGNLPYLDEEPFIVPTGPRFLVPQPVDKEGKETTLQRNLHPVFSHRAEMQGRGSHADCTILDHPYYVWTEVPDWLLERMGVASPMIAEVEKPDGDMKA
jgi:hypothetical protein